MVPRVTVALTTGDNPKLIAEAYFALTSNTVQFGARASLYAAAYGFSIEGYIGFDVLIQLWPPHFIADFQAGVQLKRGSRNLFKVDVRGTLEGPDPAAGGRQGHLRHPVVGLHRRLRPGPHRRLGRRRDRDARRRHRGRDPAERPGELAVRAAARRDASSSGCAPPRPATPSSCIRSAASRSRQGVVPLHLDRDIDRVGAFVPSGDRRFAVTSGRGGRFVRHPGSRVRRLPRRPLLRPHRRRAAGRPGVRAP